MRSHNSQPFHRAAALLIILLSLLLFLNSCTIPSIARLWRHDSGFKDENTLMREGVEAFNNRSYKKAIERFQAIKDQYPFSAYVLLAELKIADAYYNREEYSEAVYAYEDFMKLHPRNEAVPYALFQVGMCYFKQMRTIDRDQDITRKAVAEFQRLIRTYPDSPFRIRAENRLSICLQNMAKHEMYVGRFYFKQDQYKAAKARFEGVIKNFPDLGQYNEAFSYIRKCEVQLAKLEQKQAKKREKEEKRKQKEAPEKKQEEKTT